MKNLSVYTLVNDKNEPISAREIRQMSNVNRHSAKARFPRFFLKFDVCMFFWAWHGLCGFPRSAHVVWFPKYGAGSFVFFQL